MDRLRNQVLAGAALPGHQNGGITARNHVRQFINTPHRFRVSDHTSDAPNGALPVTPSTRDAVGTGEMSWAAY